MVARAAVAAGVWLCVLAPSAAGAPYIQAHRGGSIVDGVPTFPENSLAAFRNAAARDFVLEMDTKLTSDKQAVVMHDATLDRTTDCGGEVRAKSLAELSACRIDVLGSPGSTFGGVQLAPGDPRAEPVPRLGEALALAAAAGARVNLEIKNVPTDPDFDPTNDFANHVLAAVEAAKFPPSRLIIQSFWPPNLDRAEAKGYETALLTLRDPPAPFNDGAPEFAKAQRYEFVSPQWPTQPGGQPSPGDQAFVSKAHQLGLRVVPFTLNTPELVKQAAATGIDELITDDPEMARRALAEVEPPAAPIPAAPSEEQCAQVRAARSRSPVEAYDAQRGAPRVFAMQFKQEIRHVVDYADFRTKIECMIRDWVLPRLATGRPNVVAFNEDIGLMTIATGTRGAPAREIFGDPDRAPSCEGDGPAPCGTLGALAAVTAGYSREVAAYRERFADMQPVSSAFVAATDTFGRGWMQVFSDMAKRYGVYILGSNNQTPFRESKDPSEIETFRDPDLPEAPDSVFVATRPTPYNEVFMWGPEDVHREGPRPLKNVVVSNKKVPLTPIEKDIQLASGPATGPDAVLNLEPYRIPGTGARLGFATSLPAFVYGGETADPCSNTATYYMRCLDKLGANLVMQDEANPGRWATPISAVVWQPLSWMGSTWRAVSDAAVSFDYNVTPHMVGNLADLAFDGQTAITQRALKGPSCHYVGNRQFLAGEPETDPASMQHYAGPKSEFLALVPWVVPDDTRDALRKVGAGLAPGSGEAIENDYLETAIVADLPFPRDGAREGCKMDASAAPGSGPGGDGDSGAGGRPESGRGPGDGSPPAGPRARRRLAVSLRTPELVTDVRRDRRVRALIRPRSSNSSIDHYQLEVRKAGERPRRYTRLTSQLYKARYLFRGRRGSTYLLRARAIGFDGSHGNWTYSRSVVPLDDRLDRRRLRMRGGWRNVRGRGHYARGLSRATRRGATARIRRFRGRRVYVVGRRSPRGGLARLSIDGRSRIVSFYGSSTRKRARIAVVELRPGRRHRLKLTALGRRDPRGHGKRVELDALGIRVH